MGKPTETLGLGPRTILRDAAALLLSARLADARQYERAVARKMERRPIHEMRVAVRRIRSALALFGDRQWVRLEPKVKRLQDALGGVRDVQVQTRWVKSIPGSAHRKGIQLLVRAQRKALAARRRELRSEMVRWRRDVAPALSRRFERVDAQGRLGGKSMRRRVLSRFRKVSKGFTRFRRSLDARATHRLRIQVKKLRYELELLKAGFSTGSSATLVLLVPLQEKLGNLHDCDVRLDYLASFAARAEGPGQADLLALAQQVVELRRQQAAVAIEEIERWSAEDTLANLEKLFK